MAVSLEWYDDLDAVAADAAGALDRIEQAALFDRIDWFRLTRSHVLPDARLAIVRAANGQDRAWLFLIAESRGATPLASWYTLAFSPVFAGDGARLLVPLLRAAGRRFDRLALHPLNAAQTGTLEKALRQSGWRPFRSRASTNWTIATAGIDFATFWAARPAKLRNTVTRRARTHPLTIHLHRAFDAAAWADYAAIYAASWKPAEGSLPFLRALAEQEGAAGTLRLGVGYDAAGRAVAAQLWLVENGIATIHKLAHREDAKAGSPGSILSHFMFRSAIDEDHVHAIDFGLGDEPYKADWMDHAAPVWRIDAYRPATIAGALGLARELAGRLARRARVD
jgi:CelD/BcsL family acetyltransferase involved in cellulose biosynthesis